MKTPLAASDHGLGTRPETTIRTPGALRAVATSTNSSVLMNADDIRMRAVYSAASMKSRVLFLTGITGLTCLPLLVGCPKPKDAGADAADDGSAAAASSDAGAAMAAADASADGATKAAPVYAVFAGQTSTKASFHVAIERVGNDVRAVFDTGTPLAMFGKMSDDAHFSLRSKVAKGEKAATLTGELGAASLKGTFTDQSGKAQTLSSGASGALPATFDGEYMGTIGKQFVRMKLTRHTGTLSGIYRYASSATDLKLDGLVHDDGRFELTEKSGGKSTGKIVGAFATTGAILGQWQAPDGSRVAALSLEKGSGYPETRTYDNGVVVFPQERMIDGKRCKTDILFPQVRGVADKTAAKALNDYFHGDGAKAKTCEGPDDPNIPDYETSEGYALDTKKGRFVGVRRNGYAYTGGVHGGGGTQCDVIDTKTATHFKLAPKLSDAGRAKLADMVVAAFAKKFGVAKLTEAGFNDDAITLTKDSDLCLGDGWIEVDFDAYEIGPYVLGPQQAEFPIAQVKDLFTKDDVTDAMLVGGASPAPSGSSAPPPPGSAKPK